MIRSTSSGAGFSNGLASDNGHHQLEEQPPQPPQQQQGSLNTGLVKARTMSYTQKLIENGEEEAGGRKSSTSSLGCGSRPNIKEMTNKQRNWFASFEKSKNITNSNGNAAEPIDSVRRPSVKNDHTPTSVCGSPKSLPPDPATPTPPSSLNLPRDRRPLNPARGCGASDSIEDYLRNWKKNENGVSPEPPDAAAAVSAKYVPNTSQS